MREKLLFLQESEIQTEGGAFLRGMPPACRRIVLENDRPWEGMFIGFYSTYLIVDGVHKLYYALRDQDGRPSLAYAESTDGYHWIKPKLGVQEYHGSTANNLTNIPSLEGTVRYEERAKPEERYQCYAHCEGFGVCLFTSGNGFQWKRAETPLLPYFCDSQNQIFYDEMLGKYVFYLRGWDKDPQNSGRLMRTVKRGECERLDMPHSYDHTFPPFSRFPKEQPVVSHEFQTVFSGSADTDIYTMAAQPYPGAPGYYLAFPTYYRHFPEPKDGGKNQNDGEINVYFAGSTDGIHWNTYNQEPYLCNELTGAFKNRMSFVNPGMALENNGIRFYGTIYRTTHGAGEERKKQPDGKIVCYEQRKDGFVAVHFPASGGKMRCPVPPAFSGRRISVNCDCGTTGKLQIGITKANGAEYSGYGLQDMKPIVVNSLDQTINWTGGSKLPDEKGLWFEVEGCSADLFSLFLSKE